MNKVSLIKADLLRRKIVEHFSKRPKARVAKLTMGEGKEKTHWLVSRESKDTFRVVEVITKRSEFILEQPFGDTALSQQRSEPDTTQQTAPVPPADTQPGPLQTEPWDPDNPSGQFAALVGQVGLNRAMLAMPDDKLHQHFGIAKTALKGGNTAPDNNPLTNPAIPPDNVQLSHRDMSESLVVEAPTEDDMVGINVEPSDYETGPEQQDQAPMDQMIDKTNKYAPSTAEEVAVIDSLTGQTISDVKMESDQDEFELSLGLVTTDYPAVIKVRRGGRVSFNFKGQDYLLQNKWS